MTGTASLRALHVGWHLFVRDFKLRYRRALLGISWAVLPLALGGAMVAHLGARLGVAQPGALPYPLQVFLGLVVVQSFLDGLAAPQHLAKRYATLLRTVAFPREALLVAGGGFVGFNLAIRLAFVAGLFAAYGVTPAAAAPAALGCALALALAGLALGALLAPLSLLLWDVRFGLPYVGLAVYLATPVFYPPAADGLLGLVHRANPLTHVVLAARELATSGPSAGPLVVAAVSVSAAVALAWASLAFYGRAMLRACPHI